MKNIISLPQFGGFYEETFTDNYLESCREWEGETDADGVKYTMPEIDYRKTYEAVARWLVVCSDGYFEKLSEAFPTIVKGVEFDKLDSPREYNFRTDEIHALVEYDWGVLFQWVLASNAPERNDFEAWLKENYTSRSGFISFIETDLDDFCAELSNEIGTDGGWSVYLTVLFEFLCRDWDYIWPECFEGIDECIVTK